MDAELRIAILRRDGWTCQRPDCLTAGRGGRRLEIHHRYRPGRIDAAANLIVLCSDCHAWVHANETAAYELGLLVRSSGSLPTEPWTPPASDGLPKLSEIPQPLRPDGR